MRRIDDVEIEADVKVGRRRVDAGQHALQDVADAVLVHRPHVVAPQSGSRDRGLFLAVDRSGADDGDIRRRDRRPFASAQELGEVRVSGEEGDAHPVHVAGGRGMRGVEIGMGVDPQDGHALALPGSAPRHRADRAHGDAVVPADDEGALPVREGGNRLVMDRLDPARHHLGMVAEMRQVPRRGGARGSSDVPSIHDGVAEAGEGLGEPCDPRGGRSERGAGDTRGQAEGNADEGDRATGRNRCRDDIEGQVHGSCARLFRR